MDRKKTVQLAVIGIPTLLGCVASIAGAAQFGVLIGLLIGLGMFTGALVVVAIAAMIYMLIDSA